jgi:hypothetical protein
MCINIYFWGKYNPYLMQMKQFLYKHQLKFYLIVFHKIYPYSNRQVFKFMNSGSFSQPLVYLSINVENC